MDIKLISILSTKGGAGKTTISQILASGALSNSEPIGLIDTDRNAQLAVWERDYEVEDWGRVAKPDWPAKQLPMFRPKTIETVAALEESDDETDGSSVANYKQLAEDMIDEIYAKLEEWDRAGIKYAILDTRGGWDIFVKKIVTSSDLLVIPSKANQKEINQFLETLEKIGMERKALREKGILEFPELRVVITQLPPPSQRKKDIIEALGLLRSIVPGKTFKTEIQDSSLFERISAFGPLEQARVAYRSAKHLTSVSLNIVVQTSENLWDEVVTVFEGDPK